ncbi:hypothetical protein Dimus_005676 [Dionaea muscipula]
MVCSAASFRLQATTSMVVFSFSSSPTILSLIPNSLSTSLPVPGKIKCPKPAAIVLLNHGFGIHERNETHKLRALTVASAAADPAQAEITWQIVVGALGPPLFLLPSPPSSFFCEGRGCCRPCVC